jgi:uncharacterized protein YaiL (DUF2058 family)
MTDSLRDQLLKLGFKKPEPPARTPPRPAGKSPPPPQPKAKPPARPKPHPHPRPQHGKPEHGAQPKSREEIDLARAYAIRDRQEREEREASKREAEARTRERREKRLQLRTLLQGKGLNDPEADQMRHFPHAGKIKRVHVNAAQLVRLNAGELGVVQSDGHYVLVDRETALAVRELFAEALLLLPEPGEAVDDDWSQGAGDVPPPA